MTLTLFALPAQAHLMPAKQGTLNVVGDSVFAVLSVPVTALHNVDDNGDGALDINELRHHEKDIRAELDRRLSLFDGDRAGDLVTVDAVLSPEHDATPDRADHLVLLKHSRFPQPVRDLRVTCDLFGTEPQITFTASRHPPTGIEREVAVHPVGPSASVLPVPLGLR